MPSTSENDSSDRSDAESAGSASSWPSVTPSENRWRRRWIYGREDNEDTLWNRLGDRHYTDGCWWELVEDGWKPGFGWRPLIVFGADDGGNEGRMAFAHVPWQQQSTRRPAEEHTPDSVKTLDDIEADTPLEPLAPGLGDSGFKGCPDLKAWAFATDGPDRRTWKQYCFHRIDYEDCGRDIVQHEKELGRLLVACDGPAEKWEQLAKGRKWPWLKRAHKRRAQLRGEAVPPSRRVVDHFGDERVSDSSDDDGGFAEE